MNYKLCVTVFNSVNNFGTQNLVALLSWTVPLSIQNGNINVNLEKPKFGMY